jgi:hypothetical protein
MPNKVKITEHVNLAAVGWRWPTESGGEFEVTWIRGEPSLLFSIKPSTGPNVGKWMGPMPMHEKWNHAGNLKSARAMAHKFVAEGTEPE